MCLGKWDRQTSLGFWDTNRLSNLGQTTRPCDCQQIKRKTCQIVDFAVLADYRVKLKESKSRDKYYDLARELKKQWNKKVTVAPIVIGALGTVTKGLVQGQEDLKIRGRGRLLQTTALLRLARILRRILETCCHSDSSERPSADTGEKNSHKSKIIICIIILLVFSLFICSMWLLI